MTVPGPTPPSDPTPPVSGGFTVNDRRGVRRTAAGLYVGDTDTEFRRLRRAGYTLPNNPAQARMEAKRVADTVTRTGGLADNTNRMLTAQMRRQRMANIRTGANVQMAMPKMRTPLGSLEDKGVPFNVEDEKELAECRRWARAFYVTHDLVPLLVDIYSRFPTVGLEFKSTDPLIEKFYTEMFLDDLDYENFLIDMGREYYVAGEVTALAHFNESLGIWSSEEILNPDMIRVSKSMFVPEERVQLMVKETVEYLRDGPSDPDAETKSQREDRRWQYQQLQKHYPAMIQAAQEDDGLDISPALWSRIVNRPASWIDRGAPFLLRSFRTLMMEESLNAAQDAVADRLYSPMIIATLGLENMGDGLPWIPEQADLDDLRDDMQNAFMADFKLICHHMGLKIENVFGRESMPRFDQDYERIDLKLMQAWGIGSALIMGGTAAAGTYASSALNREVCELLMKGFQKQISRHITQRMKIIAEAQEHYAYEKKGGYRRPLYREVVQFNEETGEEEIVRVPELLIPNAEFASLNLRDEAQERQFVMMLKQAGVPISDKSLAINLPIDFEQELPRGAEETVDKLVAQGEAMAKAQKILDHKNLPYPPELAQYLTQTLVLRQQLAQTDIMEGQAKMADTQEKQQGAAGQMGMIPGVPPPPPPEEGEGGPEEGGAGAPVGGPPPEGGGPPPGGMPMAASRDEAFDDDNVLQFVAAAGAGAMPGAPSAGTKKNEMSGEIPGMVSGPSAMAPGILPPQMGVKPDIVEPARNRAKPAAPPKPPVGHKPSARPEESDTMRTNMPRQGKRRGKVTELPSVDEAAQQRVKTSIEQGPSSYGHRRRVSESQVEKAIRRREAQANPPTVEQLVENPNTYHLLGMGGVQGQLQADFPDIMAGESTDTTDDSKEILEDMLRRYENETGVRPIW